MASLCEVVMALGLEWSAGFTNPRGSAVAIVGAAASMWAARARAARSVTVRSIVVTTLYAELHIQGASGRFRIVQHVNKRKRRIAATKRVLPRDAAVEIGPDITGTAVAVLVNGQQVLAATLSAPDRGTFAVESVSSSLSIDDVRIRARC